MILFVAITMVNKMNDEDKMNDNDGGERNC